MKLVYLLALAAGALAAHAAGSGLRLVPDFYLYTQGGFGWFPSPVGRLSGAMGETPFMVCSVLAVVVCVVLVGRLSQQPALAALAFVLSPATAYLMYAGIDPIGLGALLAAVLSRSGLLYGLAALTHLAVAPYALLELRRMRPVVLLTVGFFLLPALLFALLATPYSGAVFNLLGPSSWLMFGWSLLVGLAMAAPMLLVRRFDWAMLFPFLAGAFCCAMMDHLQARYFLPALALTAAGATGLRLPRPDLAVGSAVRAYRWNTSRA